jgi:DNA-binding NtrC family response regulator
MSTSLSLALRNEKRKHQSNSAVRQNRSAMRSPAKILFVDDEPAVLETYKRLLGRRFAIDTAICGVEGLKAIQQRGPYAVVISDMRMPGMNGAEFLKAVRKLSPHAVTMILTGHTDLVTPMDAVNQGYGFRFLTKPCRQEVLREAVGEALLEFGERQPNER